MNANGPAGDRDDANPDLRATDDERRMVADELAAALGRGQLELGEFEQRTEAVWAGRTRGVSARTIRRSRTAAGLSAVGSAARLATGTCLPSTIFVAGGLAVGKKRFWTSGQPNRISAAITANNTKFWRSLFKSSAPHQLRVPGPARSRPRDDSARSASPPASPPSPRHSGEAR